MNVRHVIFWLRSPTELRTELLSAEETCVYVYKIEKKGRRKWKSASFNDADIRRPMKVLEETEISEYRGGRGEAEALPSVIIVSDGDKAPAVVRDLT